MPTTFRGSALPIDAEGMAEALDRLRVRAAEVWAVLSVETLGCGFLPDRRPLILFERHVFSRETGHRFDAQHPDISNRQPGGYGAGGAHQYDRLGRALTLDRKAALRSASWGIGQLMGFNAQVGGFADVEAMVTAMAESETRQLLGMAGEIVGNGLSHALADHDWATFARGYNGPGYARNRYDTRLSAAHQKYAHGPLPDLSVRAAQVYLTYLGYSPGPVDGIIGRFTRSALHGFQEDHGMPTTDDIDEDVLPILKNAVKELPE